MNTFTDIKELVKHVNTLRLQNKDRWVNYHCTFNGIKVGFKFYNTWVQILDIGDRGDHRRSGTMDIKVGAFKEWIEKSVVSGTDVSSYDLGKAKALWSILGDIPVNEADEIEAEFNTGDIIFEVGTDKTEIWHWFEERYRYLSVAKHLMGV